MHNVMFVEVDQSPYDLECVHSGILLSDSGVLTAHSLNAFVDILQVDAEDIVLDDFRVVILDQVLVIQLFVPLNLFLDRLHFLLVKTVVRVHQFNHFDSKGLPRVDVQGLVHFASRAAAE